MVTARFKNVTNGKHKFRRQLCLYKVKSVLRLVRGLSLTNAVIWCWLVFRRKEPDEEWRPLHENTVCNPKTQLCPSEHPSLCRTFIHFKCFCVLLHMRIQTASMQKTVNRGSYKYVCAKYSARWRQEDGGVRAQSLPTRSTYSQFVAEADKICFASIACSWRFEWNVATIQCKSRHGNVNLLGTPDGESGHHKVIRTCRAEMSTFLFNSCRNTSAWTKVVKQVAKNKLHCTTRPLIGLSVSCLLLCPNRLDKAYQSDRGLCPHHKAERLSETSAREKKKTP